MGDGSEAFRANVAREKRNTLRLKLGSLIHRKLAAISPDLMQLMSVLPDKWRALIQEAYAVTYAALNSSFTKIKGGGGRGVKRGCRGVRG